MKTSKNLNLATYSLGLENGEYYNNTIELKNKILSFGANAEVLSPKILREEIIEILNKASILYNQ